MIKSIMTVPWADNEMSWKGGAGKIASVDAAYKVPIIFHAVDLRVKALARIPVKVYRGETEIENWEFEDSLPLSTFLQSTELAMLLKGFSCTLKLSNKFAINKGLQWLNPFSVFSQYQNGRLYFYQQMPTGERFPQNQQFWTVEDFLYAREFNPNDDLGAGISSTEVALNDAQTSASMSKFLADFFTADALPITLVTMAAGTQADEAKRVESWFKKKLRGLRDAASRVLGITGDVKIEKLTSELKSFDFDKLDDHVATQVAHAFAIPKTVLTSQDQNFATATAEYRKFLELTVIPRCKYYQAIVNEYLIEFGQRIEFDPEELPEFQEDEASRAASLKSLVDSGVPLEAALEILGYDLSDEAQAILDKKLAEDAKPKPPQLIPNIPTNGVING